MDHHHQDIRELLGRVRARWRALSILRAIVRAALASSAALVLAILAAWAAGAAPTALAAIGAGALVLALAGGLWGLAPLRRIPSEIRVARFVEERAPSLEDRLVSAVDVMASERQGASPVLIEPLLADAAARARAGDLDAVVSGRALRPGAAQAAGRGSGRRSRGAAFGPRVRRP